MSILDAVGDLSHWVEDSSDLICVFQDGRVDWVNRAWTRLLGWSSEALRGDGLHRCVHPADQAAWNSQMVTLLRGHPMQRFRHRMLHEQGGWRWLDWSCHSLHDGTWFGIARDVTQDVSEAQTGQQERRLLEIAEKVARTGHWYVDLLTQTVHWSREVYRIHGRDPADYQPTIEDGVAAYHPEDRAEVQRWVERAIEHLEPFEFELRLVRTDGEVRSVQSSGRPEVDPVTGKATALFGIFRDVTDDIRSQRLSSMELFSQVAAHDLRQPIRQLTGLLSMARRGLELDERQTAIWEMADRSLERMDRLVREFLAYAEAGRVVTPGPVDLERELSELCEALSSDISDAGAEVCISALPIVEGSAARLRQVFQNLLLNALRYRHPDRTPVIHIDGETTPDGCLIRVRDNGVGFEPEVAESIFLPFSRHHRCRRTIWQRRAVFEAKL